mgnify:CR=1 FL=1
MGGIYLIVGLLQGIDRSNTERLKGPSKGLISLSMVRRDFAAGLECRGLWNKKTSNEQKESAILTRMPSRMGTKS